MTRYITDIKDIDGITTHVRRKMNKHEEKIITDYEKRRKAGKEIFFSYEPPSIMMKFHEKYDVDVKKDRLGNVHVTISEKSKVKNEVKFGPETIEEALEEERDFRAKMK